MSRASKDRRLMSGTEMALAGPEVEVVAKASRRRFTMEYKRKIVREADGCKTPGRGRGAPAPGGVVLLPPDDVAGRPGARRIGRGAEEAGPGPASHGPAGQEDRRAGAGDRPVAEACGACRGPGGGPKKTGGVAGDAARVREILMATVTEIGPRPGIAPTCAALDLPHTPYYSCR